MIKTLLTFKSDIATIFFSRKVWVLFWKVTVDGCQSRKPHAKKLWHITLMNECGNWYCGANTVSPRIACIETELFETALFETVLFETALFETALFESVLGSESKFSLLRGIALLRRITLLRGITLLSGIGILLVTSNTLGPKS